MRIIQYTVVSFCFLAVSYLIMPFLFFLLSISLICLCMNALNIVSSFTCLLFTLKTLVVFSGLSIRTLSQIFCRWIRKETEDNMGSSSSSYGPKAIYLDVDGKVQKVGHIPMKMFSSILNHFYWFLFDHIVYIIKKMLNLPVLLVWNKLMCWSN